MEHFYVDKYSDGRSFIHGLNPQVKILSFLMMLVSITTTPAGEDAAFLFYFILILFLIVLSGVPPVHFMKSYFSVLPFILAVTVFMPFFKSDGLTVLKYILIKSFLSVLVLTLLSSTTRFQDMLKGLERLRFPSVLLLTHSFMYRYIFVLMDEKMRVERAFASRYFGGRMFVQFKALGNIIGSLFLNTFERSERIYHAMCSRLFDGRIKTLNTPDMKYGDVLFLIVIFIASALIKVWNL